jgi:Tfp pilus assembly protein PilF
MIILREGAARSDMLSWLLRAFLVAWTLLVFLQVLQNGFVNWDDEWMFLKNPNHQSSWAARLHAAWTTRLIGEYMPLTWMTYALDRSLWQLEPAGYHLTNLLLHVATAVVVYELALRLLGHAPAPAADSDRRPVTIGAAVAALAFAVHPLRVEPVAWVSARGTILGGLLLVLATLSYVIGFDRNRDSGRVAPWWLAAAVLLFVMSLLARATGVVLPLLLLLLDVYPLGRFGGGRGRWFGHGVRHVWLEKLPFAVLALGMAPVAMWARVPSFGSVLTGWSPVHHVAAATYSAASTLAGLVAPVRLAVLYDPPTRARPGSYVAAGLTLLTVSAVVLALRRRWPAGLTAWVAFGVLLAPMSGVIPGGNIRGPQDRYSYVACLGAALVAGGAGAVAWRSWRAGRLRPRAAAAVGLGMIGVLGAWSLLSWRQSSVWQSSVTLWTHTVEVAPRSVLGHERLAAALEDVGDLDGALRHYRHAARFWPASPAPHAWTGRVLLALGRPDEAEAEFRQALALVPDYFDGHLGLGRVLAERGNLDAAVIHLEKALNKDSESAEGHLDLGWALAQAGRGTAAREHLTRALALRPGWFAAQSELAALERSERGASALPGAPWPWRVPEAAARSWQKGSGR